MVALLVAMQLACTDGTTTGEWGAPLGDAPLPPVAQENLLAGTPDWRVNKYAAGALEGYASVSSAAAGESITLHVRASITTTATWELLRLGWYNGAGARRLASGGPFAVGPRSIPAAEAATGLLACDWPASVDIAIPADAVSGLYVVRLTRADGWQSHVPLVVRDDARREAGLVQASVSTWQAYNTWGGESLYVDALGLAGGHARQVSFDRPYADGFGTGELGYYELPFLSWAESRGFDVTYAADTDLDRDPSLLIGRPLLVTVGHDEYVSRPRREAMVAALEQGSSLAFLDANSLYWQVRLGAAADGRPGRVISCFKEAGAAEDPLSGTPLATVLWKSPPVNEPESLLRGNMTSAFQFVSQPWLVRGADSWLYSGTGLAEGDTIPLLVGPECDAVLPDQPTPPLALALAPAPVQRLSSSPIAESRGVPLRQEAVAYETSAGAFVFTAGTLSWSWGLSREGYAHRAVQRMTENLFARAGLEPRLTSPTFGAEASPTVDRSRSAAAVTTVAGVADQTGLRDGPGATALFHRPIGVTAGSSGELFVADTGNHALRRIAPDASRTVTTIVGSGVRGGTLSTGTRTRLSYPQSIALGPDGTLYVADTGNDRIVRIARDGQWTASLLAGGGSGRADGTGSAARFRSPSSITLGPDGFLYATDARNARIVRISTSGQVTTVVGQAGAGFRDGPGNSAQCDRPTGIAAGDGALWFVDTRARVVRRITLDGSYTVTTVAGRARDDGFRDGPAAQARLMPQWGIASGGGALYVGDLGNSRIRIVRDGLVGTWAGDGSSGSRDGDGASARFALPAGLSLDAAGTLFVADAGSSTVRQVSPGVGPTLGESGADSFDACNSGSGLGPDWTTTGRWYCTAGRARGEQADGVALHRARPGLAQAVQARVQLTTTSTNSGVVARYGDGRGYLARLVRGYGVELVRREGTSEQLLGRTAVAFDPAPSHKLLLTVTADSAPRLTVTMNGTLRITTTDTTANPPSGAASGLWSGTTARTQYDDFSVTPL